MKKHDHRHQGKPKHFQRREPQEARQINLEEISPDLINRHVSLEAIVERISQTGGPTLFSVSDGTGMLILKGFIGPGERAYPEINEGDAVHAIVRINEYNDAFEGEIIQIKTLSKDAAEKIHSNIRQIQRQRAEPLKRDFLVKSQILDKLRNRFLKAATEIRLAVMQNRPIIVRHHNDVDGYSSGFVLERAILPLIEKQHGGGKSEWEFFQRAPCAAPFYEIDDSIRDTANSLRNVAKFSNKMPLIVIADNGSTEQDLIAIKQGKVHGADFIVIDHHPFEKDVISDEVLVHISPFLVGEDGSKFSAGMLCTELARLISDVQNVEQIPAMAAFADRIDLANSEVVEQYLQIAKKQNYSKELLQEIARVIDFVSAKLRFMEAREYIEVLFGEPRDKQKNLVSLLAPYIRELEQKGLSIAKAAVKIEKVGKVQVQWLPIEESFPGFGFYPKPGKCVSMLHDSAQTETSHKALVTVGLMNSAMTIRATDDANFSVPQLISYLRKEIPEAFVDGGGHKNAGSINFIPSKQTEIIKLFKKFVSNAH